MGILSTLEMVLVDMLPLELLRRFTLSKSLHECVESESSIGGERSGFVEYLGDFCRPFKVRSGEEIRREFGGSSTLVEAIEGSEED